MDGPDVSDPLLTLLLCEPTDDITIEFEVLDLLSFPRISFILIFLLSYCFIILLSKSLDDCFEYLLVAFFNTSLSESASAASSDGVSLPLLLDDFCFSSVSSLRFSSSSV